MELVQIMLDLGAEQVAGRLIYRGTDLAQWNGDTQQWDIGPGGHAFLERHNSTVDGVEVISAKPAARRGRPPKVSAEPVEDLETK